ncbi:group 1 truncated hemoglobin [Flavihumibacter stibioxidans]|uniref:Globin n=1 Tax=Flavihumibacter stibioxidans TaxID=1834163 RepID=A0ABR7MBV1_9BACT|nr:group 1 truncated hemoglobin [Flavihumibacter stibioxidans]MBC6492314.1 globin [Flavihumibacter stibioxidans]
MIDSAKQPAIIATDTLYQRMGGEEGIASFVDSVVEAHVMNPVIRPRFLPYLDSPDKVALIKKHFCEFLGVGCGGPETYSGRDMISVHKGMNISEAEYMAAIDDILSVLEQRQANELTKQEILYMAYSVKNQILHV